MNWSTIENGWNDYKAAAKLQWSKLSDEQLDGTMGKREQLSSRQRGVEEGAEARAQAALPSNQRRGTP
jgi:uncharacterized protein YjbJ (UPF0337 family)